MVPWPMVDFEQFNKQSMEWLAYLQMGKKAYKPGNTHTSLPDDATSKICLYVVLFRIWQQL
jgi:hypothetical protein